MSERTFSTCIGRCLLDKSELFGPILFHSTSRSSSKKKSLLSNLVRCSDAAPVAAPPAVDVLAPAARSATTRQPTTYGHLASARRPPTYGCAGPLRTSARARRSGQRHCSCRCSSCRGCSNSCRTLYHNAPAHHVRPLRFGAPANHVRPRRPSTYL